ncbi:galactoside 2-alpha-L-fucosyltransferase-like protein, putative [Bodo saltans]|uniref:Galactoside 2-alpha-L-fucosyltransferase-like protein, putative n=1 Tax=Bodo saltans TaxID=75058 RepID=A0A0S4JEP0_BODSA|nr:galactoside 2-alpha-L-fucosyltransferase-like protein, putative [Bodo saltans]|eukprot:CUG87889.1 galactoside 2-alpha-L-fucosyltransferase-like protein, putative [Bodo saltans]
MKLHRRLVFIILALLISWQFWNIVSLAPSPAPLQSPTITLVSPTSTESTQQSEPDKDLANLPERWVETLLHFYRLHGADNYCSEVRRFVLDTLVASDSAFTPELAALLQRQHRMHEAVANGTPLSNQTYLIWSLSGGLGNRFQSLVSTFMLALLSERVLLLKDWFTPLPKNSKHNKPLIFPAPYTDEYQLEALQKLFWFSNPLVSESQPRAENSKLICPIFPMMTVSQFQSQYPSHFGDAKRAVPSKLGHVKIDLSARHDKKLLRWTRVACGNVSDHSKDSDTKFNSDRMHFFFPETFVYIWTNQYFLPLLFANPFHGAQMRRLLPVKPYSTLLRLLVIPSADVMRRVALFFDMQEKRFPQQPLVPGKYVALQVRAFSFPEMPDLAKAFLKCLKGSSKRHGEPFFLASMHEPIRSAFASTYNASILRMQSERVAGDQHTGKGADADIEALVDMLLLALGNKVFLSPGSTFGTFSAAFGDIPAVRVNWKEMNSQRSVCEALLSLQPCFGSWYKYDHLFQRSNLGSNRSNNDIPCTLRPLPTDVMFC